MKNSVCFERDFLDEDNVLGFWKLKYIVLEMKYSFQKYSLVYVRDSIYNKFRNFKVEFKEIKLCNEFFKIVEDEENGFLDLGRSFQSFRLCYDKDENFIVFWENFLFLRQRLKFRFQNI